MADISIGRQIAALRKKNKITQEELADVLSVSNQAVSKWESGICCPDIQLLPQIAQFFGVTMDDLFGVRMTEMWYGPFPYAKKETDPADMLKYAKYMDKCAIDCFQNAKAAYESVISADENSIQSDQARTCLVRLRCRNGEGERCIKEQKKRLSSEPDHWRAYYLLALACHEMHREDEAWKTLGESLDKGFKNYDILLLAGDINRGLKKYQDAIAYWQQAYDMDGRHCTPLYSLAYLYEKCGEYQKALEMWGRIIAWRHANEQDENHELDWPLVKMHELQRKLTQ